MPTETHSPLPWRYLATESDGYVTMGQIQDADTHLVATIHAEHRKLPDIRLIIESVNAHAGLVAQVAALAAELADAQAEVKRLVRLADDRLESCILQNAAMTRAERERDAAIAERDALRAACEKALAYCEHVRLQVGKTMGCVLQANDTEMQLTAALAAKA